MRQIKFRVWSIGRKKWLNECMFDMKIEGAYDFSSDSSIRYNYKTDVVIEQFTGLYDNKNTEIYEGDIVTDHNGKGVVKYVESKAAYRVCYGDGYAKWFEDYTLRGERDSIEVIGNVHQHKNLIDSE